MLHRGVSEKHAYAVYNYISFILLLMISQIMCRSRLGYDKLSFHFYDNHIFQQVLF